MYTPKEKFSVMKDVVAPYAGWILGVTIFLSIMQCVWR